MLEEAYTRWLSPNEIHALLSNHNYFTINVKPVHLPKSILPSFPILSFFFLKFSFLLRIGGTIVFFDRKMLRNFRKDGHNWKKKKDGKTIKEAHEHLKVSVFHFTDERLTDNFICSLVVMLLFNLQVGNEERIHVYYAHGDDNPTFVRRCYWLLDKYVAAKYCSLDHAFFPLLFFS